MAELLGTPGYFNVTKEEAKSLIHSVLGTDGYYLLRPTDDKTAVCTICVSNRQKLINYRLMQESQTRLYYIRDLKFPSIAALIHHYSQYPINPEAKTKLLYPVQSDQGDEYVALEPARVEPTPPVTTRSKQPSLPQSPPALPDRGRPLSAVSRALPRVPTDTQPNTNTRQQRGPLTPGSNQTNEVIESLPGVHVDLPKNFVPIILDHFAVRDSSYLVRPSASSKGQFTISLVCGSSILNFKINQDVTDRKYFVTPKKKFSTVKELLETHKTSPLKSKARAGAKIFLLHPITATEVQGVIDGLKQKQGQDQDQGIPASNAGLPESLPPPWKEFFDKKHQRSYYYNPQTKETVWERPKSAKKMIKANTLDVRSSRPLPTLPDSTGSLNIPRHSIDSNMQRSPKTLNRLSKPERGLPDLPPKSPSSRRHSDISSTRQPKGISNGIDQQPHPLQTTVPKLPPKDPLPALPPKDPSPSFPSKDVPPLPPKDNSNLPPLPDKVPPKESNPVPALPPKTPTSDVPPLPPKDPSPSTSSFPPLPPKVPSLDVPSDYDYMPSPNTQRATVVAPLPPPITMEVEPPSGRAGGPPPPPAPPIPPQGIPGPPPPPPLSPSPVLKLPKKPSSSPPEESSSSGGGGRPFSANDLLQQRTKLKAKKEEEAEPRPKTGSLLENTLSNAIELRLVNIRNAMDSDEDTDVEEIDDDEDWD